MSLPRAHGRPENAFTRNYKRSRVMLFSMLILTFPLIASLAGAIESTRRLVLVVLGFSGIIFLHELGHFLVARMCSVRCDVFSIGIGPRMLGWKKGIGLSFGKSPEERGGKKPDGDEKTRGEEEDEKYARQPLEEETAAGAARGVITLGDLEQTASPAGENKGSVVTDTGKVEFEIDTPDLTGDIVGKPRPAAAGPKGQTDYRISWLPLGGYVRMLGQDDMDPTKQSSDPRSFGRRPIWQRMCIVSAGVVMNAITALVIFSIIFQPSIGVKFPPGIVGEIIYNSPAANGTSDHGGFKMGDKIIEIDGEKPVGFLEFTDVLIASALSRGTEEIAFKVVRPGVPEPFIIKARPRQLPNVRFLVVGVGVLPSTTIMKATAEEWEAVKKEAAKIKANPNVALFEPGDEIVAIGAHRFAPKPEREYLPYLELHEELQKSAGKPIAITVKRGKAQAETTFMVTPELARREAIGEAPGMLGLSPRVVVKGTEPKSPAEKAGVKAGDVLVSIGDECAFPTMKDFRSDIEKNPGQEMKFAFLRDGKPVTIRLTPRKENKVGRAGIDHDLDLKGPVVVMGTEDPRLASVPRGSTINKINGLATATWSDVFDIGRTLSPSDTVTYEYTAPDGKAGTLSVTLGGTRDHVDPIVASVGGYVTAFEYRLGVPVDNLMWTQAASTQGGPLEAVQMGFEHTWKFMKQTYMTLRGLFINTVSAKELHGIVGIAKVGHDVQDRGLTHLWFILAVVSVNLAVANFLPLPIVDGGLFLLLILEKIRGRPLSLKVQSAIQLVGIILLAGLFLFVTYNDILFVGGFGK